MYRWSGLRDAPDGVNFRSDRNMYGGEYNQITRWLGVAMEKLETNIPQTSPTVGDTYGTLETYREVEDEAIPYAN
jgi:hypothetical protein